MKMIPPEERYNHHTEKNDVSEMQIKKAIMSLGFNPDPFQFQKLSGGFQNANYLIQQDQKKIVLRFYSTNKQIAVRELGILRFLAQHNVKVPKVIDYFELDQKPILAMEFLEGKTLQSCLSESPQLDLKIFFNLGQQLAKIHLIQLPRPGFIGPEMRIGNEFENFSLFLKNYIFSVFINIDSKRLELATRDRLLKLVQDQWEIVLNTEPTSNLVHCDYNPKNILISENNTEINSAILDWEFSISGNGYLDIGNFFRFPYDYPASAEEEFIKGYKSIKSDLIPQWKEVSMLIDLGNMASLMERKEHYPKTFLTAREVINRTLDYFDY